MAGASREIEVNARPESVFRVVTAYEQYPQFIDEIVSAEIVKQDGSTVHCRFTAEVAKKRFQYTLQLVHTPFERTRWSLLEGDFKRNDGGWDLRPLDGGRRTHVTYNVDLELGFLVPKFVINSLVGANMPKMLDAVKKRAEDAERSS